MSFIYLVIILVNYIYKNFSQNILKDRSLKNDFITSFFFMNNKKTLIFICLLDNSYLIFIGLSWSVVSDRNRHDN